METKLSSQRDRPTGLPDVDALMEQIRVEVEQERTKRAEEPAGAARDSSATPELSAEEIMGRVRAEIARRKTGDALHGGSATSEVASASVLVRDRLLPSWHPAASRLPDQQQYVLSDFLRFDDADFVDVAYQTLLRRSAEPKGRQDYLDALRSGAISKVEILGLIRFSEEGRRQAVHVDGLLLPYKLHRWRHVRVIGWFLGMGMAIVRLPRLAWRLQGMEASAAREAQELGRLLNRVEGAIKERFADVDGDLNLLRAELTQSVVSRVEGLRGITARVSTLQAALESTSDALRDGKAELHGEVESLSAALAAHATRHAELAEAMDAGNSERLRDYSEAAARLTVHDAALTRLEERTRSDHRALRNVLDRLTVFLDVSVREARKASEGSDDEPPLEEQYASFEQTFRGEREQIKQRAAHYLSTLAGAGIEPGDEGVVLDLGSGRGEWLEVLAEHGYHCRGVDSNRGMLNASEVLGHEVVEADALDYLRAQPDGSFAAITSMHMVEHMPHPVVIQLLDEALRALRPGGVLILETPNPENVLVGSCMFYMDPTHLHPIPPPLLQWTVQARGFEQVEIERLCENRGSPGLTPVSDEVPGAAQINQMVAWFTAPPDYAVIARAPN